MTMSKYRNRRTEMDGIMFDSMGEAARWAQLRLMERGGLITGLERQVPFVLVEGEKGPGGRRMAPVRYVADFVYMTPDGRRHVEDFKGVRTAVYRFKKRLMWHVHGIEIEEV